MLNEELTKQIASLAPDALLKQVQQWYATPADKPDFRAWLTETATLEKLSPEQVATMRVALYCLAKDRDHAAWPLIKDLLVRKVLQNSLADNDWLLHNLHRIVGSVVEPADAQEISALAVDYSIAQIYREQLILSFQFLWVEKVLDDKATLEAYRTLFQDAVAHTSEYT